MRFATLALALLAAPAAAADPAPTIDQLVERVGDLRRRQAELAKEEAAAVADLRAKTKDLLDKLDRLGLDGPAPKPPPDPKPPQPPEPPADPLRAKLAAAYAADPAPAAARKEQAKDLAALYRQAAQLAADEAVPTAGALLARVGEAAARMLKDPAPPGRRVLADVRKAANAELGALLPTDDALTSDQRQGAATLFLRLALILEGLAQ